MSATTFCNNRCIPWKMGGIISQFQGEPSYVCTEWLISEIIAFLRENAGCCFARLNLLLNYCSMVLKGVPSYWHIYSNVCFTFESAVLVCKVRNIILNKFQKPVSKYQFVCCTASIAPPLAMINASKSTTVLWKCGFKQCKAIVSHNL